MNGIHSRSKRLRFETLEPKVLLAADLHAMVTNGDLVVVGSKGDDVLAIEASEDLPNTWTVTPASDDSINGGNPGETVTLSGVTGDMRVSLRGGNDKLTIRGASRQGDLAGSLLVRGSHGLNRIVVTEMSVGEKLSVRTREAPDYVALTRSDVAGRVAVQTGKGADTVTCRQVAVGGRLVVHAGGGWYDDNLNIDDVTVGDDLCFISTRGDNRLLADSAEIGNRFRVRVGGGDDTIRLGNQDPPSMAISGVWPSPPVRKDVETRQLQIQTGGGNDQIEMLDARVSRHLRAYLGDQDDRLTVMDSWVAGNALVVAGAGNDVLNAGLVPLSESAQSRLGLPYEVSQWPFAGYTTLDGGAGDDSLLGNGGGSEDTRHWTHWEDVDAEGLKMEIGPALDAAATPADAVNALAADLYHALADSEENLAFSPLSISAALAMVYAGAEGNTAAEMAGILHFPESSPEFHAEYGELLDSLKEAGELDDLDLNVANSLWGQGGFPFSQEYLDQILASYDGDLTDVDFINETEAAREAINQWVEEQTEDKIQDLIPEGVLTRETVLVLANAIYFDAKWAHQFEPDSTQPASFAVSSNEKIRVDMMRDTAYYGYMEQDGVQYLELPYSDGRFSMVLALPDRATPLSQVGVNAMTEDLDKFFSGLEGQRVAVSLPKFEITSMPDAKQTLIDLGMEDLFDSNVSNLDGMKDPDAYLPGNLWVQDVRHKAFIELDEAGTTAAAATAVIVGYPTSIPPEPVYFQADHPFQYYICDTQTDTILFMGHVSRPTEAE